MRRHAPPGWGRDLTVAIFERRRRIRCTATIALALGAAMLAVMIGRVIAHGGFG